MKKANIFTSETLCRHIDTLMVVKHNEQCQIAPAANLTSQERIELVAMFMRYERFIGYLDALSEIKYFILNPSFDYLGPEDEVKR